jgi:hypothetical protein
VVLADDEAVVVLPRLLVSGLPGPKNPAKDRLAN